jgi:hypothetical protein
VAKRKAPTPLLDVRWVVAALDGPMHRFLCKGSRGHWVVTMDFDKAAGFEIAEAFEALEAYRTQVGQHHHSAGGDWRVYQASTRTRFAEPTSED